MNDRSLDFEGRCHDLIYILPRNLLERTEKKYENSWPTFQPITTCIFMLKALPLHQPAHQYSIMCIVKCQRLDTDYCIYWITDVRNGTVHCSALSAAHPKPSQSSVSSHTRCMVVASNSGDSFYSFIVPHLLASHRLLIIDLCLARVGQ